MDNKTFRIFISSTFEDFIEERELLNNEIYDEINAYCKSFGYSAQFVDLRWGVSTEASINQKTMQICLEEIAKCKEFSLKPNFLAMIGNRYGWVPLPYCINTDDMESLKNEMNRSDIDIIERWYQADENAKIPEYVLLPRTGEYISDDVWKKEEETIRTILVNAALATDEINYKTVLSQSATEQEIELGIIKLSPDNINSIVLFKENEHNNYSKEIQQLKTRIEGTLREQDSENNIIRLNDTTNYLYRFKQEITNRIIELIDEEIERKKAVTAIAPQTIHDNFAKRKAFCAVENENYLRTLNNYASFSDNNSDNDNSKGPLLIIADSGMGKTTLLSQFVEETEENCIFRFYGACDESYSLYELLKSIIVDIYERNNWYLQELTKTNVIQVFKDALYYYPEEENIVIVIDGIEKCFDVDEYCEGIIPEVLNNNTRFILSCSTDFSEKIKYSDCNILQLEKRLSKSATIMLNKHLEQNNRTLRSKQHIQFINKTLETPKTPRYIKLLADYVADIKSFEIIKDELNTERDILNVFFRDLTQKKGHHKELIANVLAYIAIAPNGISEQELLSVLIESKEIRGVLSQHEEINNVMSLGKRLPFAIWSRINYDLNSILESTVEDGSVVLKFNQSNLVDVVKEEYRSYCIEATEALLQRYKNQDVYVDANAFVPNIERARNYIPLLMNQHAYSELEEVLIGISQLDTVVRIGKLDYIISLLLNDDLLSNISKSARDIIFSLKNEESFLRSFPDRLIQSFFNKNIVGKEIPNGYTLFFCQENVGTQINAVVDFNTKDFYLSPGKSRYAYISNAICVIKDFAIGKKIARISFPSYSVDREGTFILWIDEDTVAIVINGQHVFIYSLIEGTSRLGQIDLHEAKKVEYCKKLDLIVVTSSERIQCYKLNGEKVNEFSIESISDTTVRNSDGCLFCVSKSGVSTINLENNDQISLNLPKLDKIIKKGEWKINLLENGDIFLSRFLELFEEIHFYEAVVINDVTHEYFYVNPPTTMPILEENVSNRGLLLRYSDYLLYVDLINRECYKAQVVRNMYCTTLDESSRQIIFISDGIIKSIRMDDCFEKIVFPDLSLFAFESTVNMIAGTNNLKDIFLLTKENLLLKKASKNNRSYQSVFRFDLISKSKLEQPTLIESNSSGVAAIAYEGQSEIHVYNNSVFRFRITGLKLSIDNFIKFMRLSSDGHLLLVVSSQLCALYNTSICKEMMCFNTKNRNVLYADFNDNDTGIMFVFADGSEYFLKISTAHRDLNILPKIVAGDNCLYGMRYLYEPYVVDVLSEAIDATNYSFSEDEVNLWFTKSRYMNQRRKRNIDGESRRIDENEGTYKSEGLISIYENELFLNDNTDDKIKTPGWSFYEVELSNLSNDENSFSTYLRRKRDFSSETYAYDTDWGLICITVVKSLNVVIAINLDKLETIAVYQIHDDIIGNTFIDDDEIGVVLYLKKETNPMRLLLKIIDDGTHLRCS